MKKDHRRQLQEITVVCGEVLVCEQRIRGWDFVQIAEKE